MPGTRDLSPLDLLTARFRHHHYAPHTHEEYAIGVCTAGVETIDYRGERRRSGPGTILVIEPGEPHTGGPLDADGFAYRAMYPAASLLPAPSGRRPGADAPAHFPRPVLDDPPLAAELARTHRALCHGPDPFEAETRLLALLGNLVRRHATAGERTVVEVPGAARIAEVVRGRLADELLHPPSLARIAADLGLSRYQVLRAFRSSVGMPPYAWLAQYRVGRARTLLAAGHRPAQVAARVGFADQAHLTRWFRRVLGVTPGEFRNSVQDSPPPAG